MEIEFYRLFEQIDEHHVETTFYHMGVPSKPFEETVEEAKELFLLRASEGEMVDEWGIVSQALIDAGYHEVQHKDTQYMHSWDTEDIRHLCKPTPIWIPNGYDFEESEFLLKVNLIRLKHGKNQLTSDDFQVEDKIPTYEGDERCQALGDGYVLDASEEEFVYANNESAKVEPPRTATPDDFRMDDLEAFLPTNNDEIKGAKK